MTYRIFLIVLVAAGVILLAGVAGCSKVNQENADKIKVGMTVAEVKAILGEPTGSKSEKVPVVGGTKMIWKSGDKSITVDFLNEKVL